MFMGPLEDMKPWSTKNILGVHRFLYKVWEMSQFVVGDTSDVELERLIHKTIKKVGEDVEKMSYNTAISAMMVLVNKVQEVKAVGKKDFESLLIILSPFAPHMCEELWSRLGHTESIFKEKWPEYDPAKVIDSEIEMPVKVNGKTRAKLRLPADISEDDARQMALADENVKKYIVGEPKKVIVIKGKLISIVA